ncbi:UNVERIFIED_CONTAM: Basic form of pathogenesis-related protein 1 [Sesamum angustifolium]|uniref:Basic form of pathogenesis-related protein 1 n=1 Tax=Sesamum angustifolium TaxID=2727405 RepID=A0AAW2QCF4_9LAMI
MPINTKHLTLTFSSKSKSHFTYHHNGLSQNPPIPCNPILHNYTLHSPKLSPGLRQRPQHRPCPSGRRASGVEHNAGQLRQSYANQRVADCALTHSNGIYGENLAKGSSSSFSGVSAVNMWVAEKQCYDYNTNSCIGGKQCLHYTQVVWHDSTQLGCARVQCSNGWYYVVCNYDAPGNWEGEWPY